MYQVNYVKLYNDIFVLFVVHTKMEPLGRSSGVDVILQN